MEILVILVCSDIEWASVMLCFPKKVMHDSPYGQWFTDNPDDAVKQHNVIWFKSGWGKIGSAGATQYIIDTWHPSLVINIGTCGGFEGRTRLFDILLAEKTVVYDMNDLIGEAENSIKSYTTSIDLSWLENLAILSLPRVVIATGDQDVNPERLSELVTKFGASAGDWESGAIAWVCTINNTRLLILRGVSDIVSKNGNPAYAIDEEYFTRNVRLLMTKLAELARSVAASD